MGAANGVEGTEIEKITKTEIYVANAGDTRCVIAAKGRAKDLSTDHKPDLPNEKRRI